MGPIMIPRDILHKRRSLLVKKLEDKGVDAFITFSPANIFYLLGTPEPSYPLTSPGMLMLDLRSGEYVLLYPSLYKYEFEEAEAYKIMLKPGEKLYGRLKQVLVERGVKRLGVNFSEIKAYALEKMKEAIGDVKLKNVGDVVEDLRAVKSEFEVNLMREASKITIKIFESCLDIVKEGVSEYEILAKIRHEIAERGCKEAFDIIVASGANTKYPHAKPTGRKVRRGDIILVDMGVRYEGYCSDMTRLIILGSESSLRGEVKKALDILLEAQEAAINSVKEGIRADELDSIARERIRVGGYSEYFIHGLGHGVGIEVHEKPSISKGSTVKLKSGMTITIEPGIYTPKWGIRVEDLVVVRGDGVYNLTGSLKKVFFI